MLTFYKALPHAQLFQRIFLHESVTGPSSSESSIVFRDQREILALIGRADAAMREFCSLVSSQQDPTSLSPLLEEIGNCLLEKFPQVVDLAIDHAIPELLLGVLAADDPATGHSALFCCCGLLSHGRIPLARDLLSGGLWQWLVCHLLRNDETSGWSVMCVKFLVGQVGRDLELLFVDSIPFQCLLDLFDAENFFLSGVVIQLFNKVMEKLNVPFELAPLFGCIPAMFDRGRISEVRQCCAREFCFVVYAVTELIKNALRKDIGCVHVLLGSTLIETLIELGEPLAAVLDMLRILLTSVRKLSLTDQSFVSSFVHVCDIVNIDSLIKCIRRGDDQDGRVTAALHVLREVIKGRPAVIPDLARIHGCLVASLSEGTFRMRENSLILCMRIVECGNTEMCGMLCRRGFLEKLVDALLWDGDERVVRRVLETIRMVVDKFEGSVQNADIRERLLMLGIKGELGRVMEEVASEGVAAKCLQLLQMITRQDE
jgi:hypothetical protein